MVERIRLLLEVRQLTPTQFADAIGIARPIVSHILSGRNKPSLEVVQRILAAMPDLSMPWLLNGTGPMLATVSATAPVAVAAPAASVALPTPVVAAEPLPAAPVPVAVPAATPAAAKPIATQAPEASPGPASAFVDEFGENQVYDVKSSVVIKALVAAPVGPEPSSPPAASAVVNAAAPRPRRFAPAQARPVSAPAPVAQSELAAPLIYPLPEASDVLEVPVTPVPAAAPAPLPAVPFPDPSLAPASVRPASSDLTAAALFAGAEKPIRRIVIFYRDGSFADYQPE